MAAEIHSQQGFRAAGGVGVLGGSMRGKDSTVGPTR